jgi:electron transfer flavoprotein beta subunit
MMTMAQKVPFDLVALDGPAGGFTDAAEVADRLHGAITAIDGFDPATLLLFGGWESASRAAGATMQILGEMLGIAEQFQGVDELTINEDGSMNVLERIEGGKHQTSTLAGPPAVFGWATGNLPEPPNNPQVGMQNMRTVMPSLQKAQPAPAGAGDIAFEAVELPKQKRETRIVRDAPPEEIAQDIIEWIQT